MSFASITRDYGFSIILLDLASTSITEYFVFLFYTSSTFCLKFHKLVFFYSGKIQILKF